MQSIKDKTFDGSSPIRDISSCAKTDGQCCQYSTFTTAIAAHDEINILVQLDLQ